MSKKLVGDVLLLHKLTKKNNVDKLKLMFTLAFRHIFLLKYLKFHVTVYPSVV